MNDETCLQESAEKKAKWLEEAKRNFPPGLKVKVVKSDLSCYIGLTGTVIGYDLGLNGDWPAIQVTFDQKPPRRFIDEHGNESFNIAEHDIFYGDGESDDEIIEYDALTD